MASIDSFNLDGTPADTSTSRRAGERHTRAPTDSRACATTNCSSQQQQLPAVACEKNTIERSWWQLTRCPSRKDGLRQRPTHFLAFSQPPSLRWRRCVGCDAMRASLCASPRSAQAPHPPPPAAAAAVVVASADQRHPTRLRCSQLSHARRLRRTLACGRRTRRSFQTPT